MTRRSLTPRERALMYEDQDRLCALCCRPITLHDCIAEHWVTVESGNTHKPDYLLCKPCAHRKTWGTKATTYGSDTHARAKVKRLAAGVKKRRGRQIPSRPFPKAPAGFNHFRKQSSRGASNA